MASTSPPKARAWVQPLRIVVVAVLAQLAGSETIHSAAVRWPAVGVVLALVEAIVVALPASVTSEPATGPEPPGPTT